LRFKDVDDRIQRAYRMREKLWLERLLAFNSWPLLFICGAKHVQGFRRLLEQNGIEVVIFAQDWPEN